MIRGLASESSVIYKPIAVYNIDKHHRSERIEIVVEDAPTVMNRYSSGKLYNKLSVSLYNDIYFRSNIYSKDK